MASHQNQEPVSVRACMGGWCNRRENCANYGRADKEPSERLCKGGIDAFVHRGAEVGTRREA